MKKQAQRISNIWFSSSKPIANGTFPSELIFLTNKAEVDKKKCRLLLAFHEGKMREASVSKPSFVCVSINGFLFRCISHVHTLWLYHWVKGLQPTYGKDQKE